MIMMKDNSYVAHFIHTVIVLISLIWDLDISLLSSITLDKGPDNSRLVAMVVSSVVSVSS